MGLSNGAILLFLRQLVGIYALSGETMELAITLVTIHAGCAIIFWPLSFVLPNALRAANDVKFTMVVSILSMACWRLGFSYLLCVRMGCGCVGGYGHRLDLPRDLLCAALPQRRMENKISGITIRRKA